MCDDNPLFSNHEQRKIITVDYNNIKTQLAAGSRKAYEELFKHLYKDLCNYAYHIIPDRDCVEDEVQAVFITLWESHGDAGKIDYLKSYLYRCVYNACLKKLEHEKVKAKYYNESEYHLVQLQFETFEASYDDIDMMGELHDAIELLPEKNKEVVKLRFIEGLNTQEVSKRLDISPRTVETHVSKALRILREKINPSYFPVIFFSIVCTCIYILSDHR